MSARDSEDRIFSHVPQEQRLLFSRFHERHSTKAIEVDGKPWSYFSCGQGSTTLLFLAGAFLRADMWFYAIGELENQFRILAPDSNMLVGLSPSAALEAIPRIMKEEGVSTVTVIGLSAGGGMAQLLLQRYPDLVDDVVLSHTGVLDARPGLEAQIRRLTRIVKLLPIALVQRVLAKRTSGTCTVTTPWRVFHDAYFHQSTVAVTKPMVLDFLRFSLSLRKNFSFEPTALRAWRGCTLIMTSKDDSVTFGSVEQLRERFPQSRVHVFESGGHHTFMLYPEAYTATLAEFLLETSS